VQNTAEDSPAAENKNNAAKEEDKNQRSADSLRRSVGISGIVLQKKRAKS
jgi:hypothetical protein